MFSGRRVPDNVCCVCKEQWPSVAAGNLSTDQGAELQNQYMNMVTRRMCHTACSAISKLCTIVLLDNAHAGLPCSATLLMCTFLDLQDISAPPNMYSTLEHTLVWTDLIKLDMLE